MTELAFRAACADDADKVAELVNLAYCGEGAGRGWTTEADLLGGPRTDRGRILALLAEPGARVELCLDGGALAGCVELRRDGAQCYLGMLSIDPRRQSGGLGKALLERSEELARGWGCARMRMTVITTRAELIAYYERRGYRRAW